MREYSILLEMREASCSPRVPESRSDPFSIAALYSTAWSPTGMLLHAHRQHHGHIARGCDPRTVRWAFTTYTAPVLTAARSQIPDIRVRSAEVTFTLTAFSRASGDSGAGAPDGTRTVCLTLAGAVTSMVAGFGAARLRPAGVRPVDQPPDPCRPSR